MAGVSGGLGKTAAPGWGAGEMPPPEVMAVNACRCEYLL